MLNRSGVEDHNFQEEQATPKLKRKFDPFFLFFPFSRAGLVTFFLYRDKRQHNNVLLLLRHAKVWTIWTCIVSGNTTGDNLLASKQLQIVAKFVACAQLYLSGGYFLNRIYNFLLVWGTIG